MSSRVFLCVGVSRYSGNKEYFVMTLCENYEIVTFWDLRLNCKFELYGRIGDDQKSLLQKMLESPHQLIEMSSKVKFKETEKNKSETLNDSDAKKSINENILWEEQNIMNMNQSLGFDSDNVNDELEINENQKIELMKKDKQTRKKKGKKNSSGNKNKSNFNFLMKKKMNEAQKNKNCKTGYQLAIHDFYYKNKKVNSVNLPWKSIELIVGKRNLWANLQNENPSCILYELNNKNRWLPYFNIELFFDQFDNENSQKVSKQHLLKKMASGLGLSSQKPESKSLKNMEIEEVIKFIKHCWYMPFIQNFFHFKPCKNPITYKQKNNLENEITKNIQFTIQSQRSTLNLETRWKNDDMVLISLLDQFLNLLHEYELNEIENADHSFLNWTKKLKEVMPANYNCKYLPLRFSVNDSERIRLLFNENYEEFYLYEKSFCSFVIKTKVFPYINKVNSIRTIILCFSKAFQKEDGNVFDDNIDPEFKENF